MTAESLQALSVEVSRIVRFGGVKVSHIAVHPDTYEHMQRVMKGRGDRTPLTVAGTDVRPCASIDRETAKIVVEVPL